MNKYNISNVNFINIDDRNWLYDNIESIINITINNDDTAIIVHSQYSTYNDIKIIGGRSGAWLLKHFINDIIG